MKLRPLQIVGLIAIVVFGGILAVQLTSPKRDPMELPSGVNLRDLPSPDVAMPTPVLPTPAIPSAPGDQLAIGSDAAKDDLYCSGVIFAFHQTQPDAASEDAQARREAIVALAEAGVAKLKAENVATDATTAGIADAHALKAAQDFDAQTLRISEPDCLLRAAAVIDPPAPQ